MNIREGGMPDQEMRIYQKKHTGNMEAEGVDFNVKLGDVAFNVSTSPAPRKGVD
jgi:hypothetical protein